MKFRVILLFIFGILLISCEGGLKPEPEGKSYLKGEIIYKDGNKNWPTSDSLFDLRVVAFKNFPPSDVFQEVLSGSAYFTNDSLPYYVDKTDFILEISDSPVELKYIAIAQQYGGILEWKAIGVYTESGDNTKHSSVFIDKGETKVIQILVDFNNLPPQPFN